jgi:hypothetical protein
MADTRIYNARLYPSGVYYALYWDIENPAGNTLDIYLAYSSDNKTWTSFRYNSGIMETMSGMTMSISAAMVPAGNRMRMRIGYKKNSSSTAVDTYSNWTNIVTSAPTMYAPSSGSVSNSASGGALFANEITGIKPNLGPGRCPGSLQSLYAFDPASLSGFLTFSVTGYIATGSQFMGVGIVYRGVDREGKYNLLPNLSGGWSDLYVYTSMTPTYGSTNSFSFMPSNEHLSAILGRIEQGETIQFGAYFQYASGRSAIVPLKNLLQSGGCTTIWKNAVTSDVGAPVVFTSSTANKPAKAYIYADSKWQITGAAPPTNYFHPDAIARNTNLKQGYAIYLPTLDLVEGKAYYLVDGATQATCFNDAGTTWTKNGTSTTTSTVSTTYCMHTSATTSAKSFTYREAYPWLVLRASATSSETENTILGYMPRIYASS